MELLKIRFGEMALHNCVVMLKDVADSKRINGFVHQAAGYIYPIIFWHQTDMSYSGDFEMDVLVVSRLFWPTFRNDSLVLPTRAQKFGMMCH